MQLPLTKHYQFLGNLLVVKYLPTLLIFLAYLQPTTGNANEPLTSPKINFGDQSIVEDQIEEGEHPLTQVLDVAQYDDQLYAIIADDATTSSRQIVSFNQLGEVNLLFNLEEKIEPVIQGAFYPQKLIIDHDEQRIYFAGPIAKQHKKPLESDGIAVIKTDFNGHLDGAFGNKGIFTYSEGLIGFFRLKIAFDSVAGLELIHHPNLSSKSLILGFSGIEFGVSGQTLRPYLLQINQNGHLEKSIFLNGVMTWRSGASTELKSLTIIKQHLIVVAEESNQSVTSSKKRRNYANIYRFDLTTKTPLSNAKNHLIAKKEVGDTGFASTVAGQEALVASLLNSQLTVTTLPDIITNHKINTTEITSLPILKNYETTLVELLPNNAMLVIASPHWRHFFAGKIPGNLPLKVLTLNRQNKTVTISDLKTSHKARADYPVLQGSCLKEKNNSIFFFGSNLTINPGEFGRYDSTYFLTKYTY